MTYLVLLTLTLLGLVFSQREKSTPLLVILGISVVLPFIAVRHLPLFALAVLVFSGEHIADAWSRVRSSLKNNSNRSFWIPSLSFIAATSLLLLSFPNFTNIRVPIEPVPLFPHNAVSLLKESKISGNLAVEFNWGKYVLWHLGPDIQVSIDGRRETVYPEDVHNVNFSFLYGIRDWDSHLVDFNTEMVLVKKSFAELNLMRQKQGWELLYEDSTSALFASQDWSKIDTLRKESADFTPPPPKELFP